MIQSISAGHAKAYFSDALIKSDYYINDQELAGRLYGRLGERLGLRGAVDKETFFALCENRSPATGDALTPRTRLERRVGYDINFHCPKSVSIVHAFSNDSHIADAFQDSVTKTMAVIEADCETRVRKDGAYNNRKTDEMIWAEFMHQTARPVEGHAPDPHLHSHCFVFNMTWDKEEGRIKAGDFAEIKRDMPYYQAMFHKIFSDNLIKQGYAIRRTAKSFEIEGVPQKVIDLFSKRTDEIGKYAKEKGITDPAKLSEIGALTRSKKQKGLSMSELKAIWRQEIKNLQDIPAIEVDQPVRFAKGKTPLTISAQDCADHALDHCFVRASVKDERRLLESAFRHGIGDGTTSSEDIAQAVGSDPRIIKIKEKNRLMCTTKEVLAEEQEMVDLARQGRGAIRPIYDERPEILLKGQQGMAVLHVLTTSNRVAIIRGAAGTGKTTLMKEARRLIEAKDKNLTVVAPSGTASREVLKTEGFDKANTVARLLLDTKMQETIQDGVLWVDEAGMLGTKDMSSLIKLAIKKNAQLILGGDTRQHASVVRGDALRILNTVAGIKTAEVSKIYRQKDFQYKTAVEELAEGKIKSAFERLERMEAIQEIDPLKPNEELVKDYVALVKKGKSALVISPTHKQGESLTHDIRQALKKAGKIGKREARGLKLDNLNFTDAEKGDRRNIKKGQVIQFNQNTPKIKRGSLWTVSKTDKSHVEIINKEGQVRKLPHDMPGRYDVFEHSQINIARGDKLMTTRGGFDKNKKRLENGQTFEVLSVAGGTITMRNKISKATYAVSKDFGHLTHAHCLTSHAAQGKTVDHVLISQPASTFGATNAKQFYVSISRAKFWAKIYTDDKKALLKRASELGDRQSAMELVESGKDHLDKVIEQHQKNYSLPDKPQNNHEKNKTLDLDYER